MMMQKVNLPENVSAYPHVWKSNVRPFRVIVCPDDLQLICQLYQSPKWRSISFHAGLNSWSSVYMRWSHDIDDLPMQVPNEVPQKYVVGVVAARQQPR